MLETFTLTSDILTDRKIPAVTLQRPAADVGLPRVIVLHGLFSRKEEYFDELYQLARRGFCATAIDLVMHGDREDSYKLADLLESDFLGAMQSLIYGAAKDVSALLDYWNVAGSGAGLLAISAGGLAAHVAAVSEKRIGAIAAVITSPDWSTADPRLRAPEGSPTAAMLSSLSPVNRPEAYAPTALLQMVGSADERVSPDGALLLNERLAPLYASRGISDRLALSVYPGVGHAYLPEMRDLSIKWLEKHLL